MHAIWMTLLMKVVEYLTSDEFISLVKKLVITMFDDNQKTGDEKRQYVLDELKASGAEFSSNLINLGIEASVAYIKEKGVKTIKASLEK